MSYDHAKWVWSWKFLIFVFLAFLLGYYLSINLAKTPWRLGNWFSRNSTLSDCKNNKTTKKLSALFGYIFKLISVSSDSFCLIASHIFACWQILLWRSQRGWGTLEYEGDGYVPTGERKQGAFGVEKGVIGFRIQKKLGLFWCDKLTKIGVFGAKLVKFEWKFALDWKLTKFFVICTKRMKNLKFYVETLKGVIGCGL